ncbi:MAG: transporter [Gemmatimonadales bacterium]|nr:MAG: transporter [Gemmatimonadales bacterium]
MCSAPHAAPSLAASGSILVLEPGAGWIQLAARGVRSDRFFGAGGETHDLPAGTVSTGSVYLTGAVGLVRGIELWAQVPVHHLRVVDPAQARNRTGIGDPRLALRVGTELLGLSPRPVSLRIGLKAPGSDFPVDPRILPLTEGQLDYEIAAELGTPIWSDRLYVVGWAGYRWRTEDTSTGREPGDERFAHLALGTRLGSARMELAIEAMDGIGPIQNGVSLPASARRLVQINPSVGWVVGRGRLEAGAQIPVSGRNLPTGTALSLGYLVAWGGR